jgi:YVTN family beta-propeller protein
MPSEFAQLKTLDVELTRKRRRMYAGAALIGVLAAAVAIPVFALGQGSGGGTIVAPNSVAIIDAESNDVIGSVQVGIRPGPIAAGEGAVWVGNLDDRTLTRVDPVQRAQAATIPLDGRTPTGVAAGEGAVWVAHGRLGQLTRVDPQFNQVGEPIDVAGRGGLAQGSVAVGDGSVWAAFGDSTVASVDPVDVRVVESSFGGSAPAALVVARGSVWVANAGDSTVSRFDPATLLEGPLRTISVGQRPTGVAYGGGALWVANSGDGTVTRIDPSTYSTTTITVGPEPVAVAADEKAVWIADATDGALSRIDMKSNDVVETISVGNAPSGVAVSDGSVWVSVAAP